MVPRQFNFQFHLSDSNLIHYEKLQGTKLSIPFIGFLNVSHPDRARSRFFQFHLSDSYSSYSGCSILYISFNSIYRIQCDMGNCTGMVQNILSIPFIGFAECMLGRGEGPIIFQFHLSDSEFGKPKPEFACDRLSIPFIGFLA